MSDTNSPSEDELAREQAEVQQQIDAASARIDRATADIAQIDAKLAAARAKEAASQQRITDLTAELQAAHTAALTVTETLANQLQQKKITEIGHSLADARLQHERAATGSAQLSIKSLAIHRSAQQIIAQAKPTLRALEAERARLQEQHKLAHAQIGRAKLTEFKAAIAARILAVEEAQILLDEATRALERLQRSVADLLGEWPELQEEAQNLLPKPPGQTTPLL